MTFTHEIGKVVCDLDLIVAKISAGMAGPG